MLQNLSISKHHSFPKMKTLRLVFVAQIFLSLQLQAQQYNIPTRFYESPVPPAPNYSNENNWSALPYKKDMGDLVPQGCSDNQATAAVDVFYIHPTLYSKKPKTIYKWNHDINDPKLNRTIDKLATKYQATTFNAAGRLYVPRYREAHFSVFLTEHLDDKKAALDVAYSDVEAAFNYYLENYNQGRPFIIASHSQGTIHAVRLLKYKIIGTPLQQQLVVAYLPGMAVPKDSLPGLPVCIEPNSIGCFTSWGTYKRGHIPATYNQGLARAVCVNPISWKYEDSLTYEDNSNASTHPNPTSGKSNITAIGHVDNQFVRKLGSYTPKEMHRGAVLKPFGKVYPQISDAQVFGGLLWITKPKFPGAFLYQTSNFHSGDINLFYIDIRENAQLRASTFVQQNPTLLENIENKR